MRTRSEPGLGTKRKNPGSQPFPDFFNLLPYSGEGCGSSIFIFLAQCGLERICEYSMVMVVVVIMIAVMMLVGDLDDDDGGGDFVIRW